MNFGGAGLHEHLDRASGADYNTRMASTSQPQLTCCAAPAWVSETDLGHADGFDFVLGSCASCGRAAVNAFCVAASSAGFFEVSDADAATMRSLPASGERKQWLRAWAASRL